MQTERFLVCLYELREGRWAVELSGAAGLDVKRLPRSVADVAEAKAAAAVLLVEWGVFDKVDIGVSWTEKPTGHYALVQRPAKPVGLDDLIEQLTALRKLGIAGNIPVQIDRTWYDVTGVRFDPSLEKNGCVVIGTSDGAHKA